MTRRDTSDGAGDAGGPRDLGAAFSDDWRAFRATTDLDEYDTRWDRLAAAGRDVHGEADFVMTLAPATVLDAGCGAGRVAIELARRGVATVGVDLDPDLLARARRRAPELDWVHADLASIDLGRRFDVVVMAGNVLPFVRADRRADAVAAAARHLRPGGALVAGATLRAGWPTVAEYDAWCVAAGLVADELHGGWARERFDAAGAHYAVTVHRRPADGAGSR